MNNPKSKFDRPFKLEILAAAFLQQSQRRPAPLAIGNIERENTSATRAKNITHIFLRTRILRTDYPNDITLF